MRLRASGRLERAIAAAGSLTGNRFGLLVASSLVATAAIVAAAMTGAGDGGALAALLARKLPSPSAAPAPAPVSAPTAAAGGPASVSSSPTPSAAPASTATPAPDPAPAASAEADRSHSEPAPAAAPEAKPGRIGHVFEISLASPGYEAAFGAEPTLPYLATTLRSKGELLSGYSLLSEAALPNGVATIAGQPPNPLTEAECPGYEAFKSAPDAKGLVAGAGCVYPVEALTLADQLESAHLSWRAYVDGMVDASGRPSNCVHPEPGVSGEPGATGEPAPGGYVAARNPFVYFHSLLDLGSCSADDVPLEFLPGDLRKPDSTPSFLYIAPDPCDAGVPGQCPAGTPEGPASADAFLEEWVPQILASPAYKKDGVLIVSFGSVDPPSAEAPPAATGGEPLRVGALLLSRFAPPGASDAAAYDPYSLLRSVEDLFGLEPLGLAGRGKVASFAAGLLGETGGD